MFRAMIKIFHWHIRDGIDIFVNEKFHLIIYLSILTVGIEHEVAGESEDDGEDDGGEGEIDVGVVGMQTYRQERINNRDVPLHRHWDCQVDWHHQRCLERLYFYEIII